MVGLIVPSYGFFALTPGTLSDPVALARGFTFLALAGAIFICPVLGIHRLLGDERQRLLDELSLRSEATLAELHQPVDNGALGDLADLRAAIGRLQSERNMLNGIPT